ncbi:MAG: hypothetical protein ABJP45_06660 [Cyclobacteriaceae bacterium]
MSIIKCLLLFVFLSLLGGCQPALDEELEGIWSLQEVNVDGLDKMFNPTFIEIQSRNRFAVSQTSGDLVGMYRLSSRNLFLRSDDQKWFNTNWELRRLPNGIGFFGLEYGYRTTELRFRKIKEIPDFQTFENSIVGKWEIYKIRTASSVQDLTDTWFTLDNNKNYSITSGDTLLEKGSAIVDTRHRKIIFENDETSWKAWFYGKELRLDNEKLDIQYRLKK